MVKYVLIILSFYKNSIQSNIAFAAIFTVCDIFILDINDGLAFIFLEKFYLNE